MATLLLCQGIHTNWNHLILADSLIKRVVLKNLNCKFSKQATLDGKQMSNLVWTLACVISYSPNDPSVFILWHQIEALYQELLYGPPISLLVWQLTAKADHVTG